MKRVIVVGGGPAGYVAAIRAAQLGADVTLIEGESVGGTCLNVGCIPTKALLHTAKVYRELMDAAAVGLEVGEVKVNWPIVQQRKQAVVNRLVGGVAGLLKANGVKIHSGTAVLEDAHTVKIGDTSLVADTIILAVGSEPVKLGFPGADLPGVIDSTAALSLPDRPRSLAIIGGGVIGVEFAAMYRSFGADVTVIEALPEILPPVDGEIAALVRNEMSKQGVVFFTGARLTEVAKQGGKLSAAIVTGEKRQEVLADYVLVAVGRRPRTENLGLARIGIETEKGKIITDPNFQTNIAGIYAVGDCNGKLMLAHAASAQAVAAVEHSLGHTPAYYGNIVPSCIYTEPEVAGVGLTEEQARSQRLNYKVGKFPLAGNGKTVIENGGTGLVKILTGAKYGDILGVHIFGPRATDLITEAALAIRLEATLDELISTIHAHPTIGESMVEAALAVDGISIHWPPAAKR